MKQYSVFTDDQERKNKITVLIFAGKNRMNIVVRELKDKIVETIVREQIIALHSGEITLQCTHARQNQFLYLLKITECKLPTNIGRKIMYFRK